MNEHFKKHLQYQPEEQKYLTAKFQGKQSQIPVEIDGSAFLESGQRIAIRLHNFLSEGVPHKHNYIEIIYLEKGELINNIGDETITMKKGDFLLMDQNITHCIQPSSPDTEGILFMIRPEFFDIPFQMLQGKNVITNFLVNLYRKNKTDLTPRYLFFSLGGQKAIENLIENLITSVILNNHIDELISQYTLGLVFLHILDGIDRQIQPVSGSQWDTIIGETLKYIDSQYKTAKLGLIAAEFHQTPSAMSKMIKKETGTTFQELLIRKRFFQAIRLLTETNLRVEEIAVNIGYENLSYFYRQFKMRYGMTPRQYRKLHQERSLGTGNCS